MVKYSIDFQEIRLRTTLYVLHTFNEIKISSFPPHRNVKKIYPQPLTGSKNQIGISIYLIMFNIYDGLLKLLKQFVF